jgi:parvulin-like peptidyl-prolyl isomerase
MKHYLFAALLGLAACGPSQSNTDPEPAPSTQQTKAKTPQAPPKFARAGRFELSEWELKIPIQEQMKRLAEMGNPPEELAKIKAQLKQQALEQLFSSILLADEAERRGFSVPRSDVETIFTTKVTPESRPPGATDAELRAYIEREMLASKAVEALRGETTLSDADLEKTYRDALTSLTLAYIRVPSPDAKAQVSEGEAIAYANEHESDLKAFYEKNKEGLAQAAGAKVRYIAAKKRPGATPEEVAAAKKKIEEAKTRAAAGEDFATLAQQLSEDKSSAARGGDLGWLGEGKFLPQIESAAMKLSAGQVSEVIEAPTGFYLLKVEETRSAKTPTFEESRINLASAMLGSERAGKATKDRAQAIFDKLKAGTPIREASNDGQTPGLIVEEVNLSLLDEALPGLGTDPKLLETVKSLTSAKPLPEGPITLGTSLLVVALQNRKDADMSAFASQKEELRKQLLQSRQAKALKEWLDQRIKEAQASGEMEINQDFLSGI